MDSTTVTIPNPAGLHARPAAELARLAASLGSRVTVETDGRVLDAASVLSVMAAGIVGGQEVVLRCEGPDAAADLATVAAAVRSGLGELVP
jgi:phosphotransferase system HPr (HPr) family protein